MLAPDWPLLWCLVPSITQKWNFEDGCSHFEDGSSHFPSTHDIAFIENILLWYSRLLIQFYIISYVYVFSQTTNQSSFVDVILCCTACTVPNCDECSKSIEKCKVCSAGYYHSSYTECIGWIFLQLYYISCISCISQRCSKTAKIIFITTNTIH